MSSSSPEASRRRALLQALPSIDELLSEARIAALGERVSRALLLEACRSAVAEVRSEILAGAEVSFTVERVEQRLARLAQPNLRRVLNATGVVLHTNLGRAPLSARAVDRVREVASGYCNLELDLDEGERGSRFSHVVELLCRLTGAEDAIVVNNCAAATVLTLGALAQGREVIVSRGELVEIGGGFRVPDVMRQSGCTLVEVGTTNRTRVGDYEAALTATTGLLLKVHRSNFAVVGFTEEATTSQLVALGRARGVPVFEDLGSGALEPLHGEGLTSEPTVRTVVAAGADVVAFSGDKLLGGPQAGILVGRREAISRLARHPLQRALRVDKLTVAALEATLEAYRDGTADAELPARAMLLEAPAALERRAAVLAAALAREQVRHRVVTTTSRVGGGSMPLAQPPSFAVAIEGAAAQRLHDELRAGSPPIVARICDDELWLDVRCLTEADCLIVASRVAHAVRGTPC
ncbi:MAG: L-seryl-tRNA(Sec) selenium transferase [Myxococcaceae bacterium]|nr:L-seryl-tRNA(Sec) selenium transferase [Myxococcaceae bacterium]